MLIPVANLVLALAQIDTCVGDFSGNAELIIERTRQAAGGGADLVLFPEMAVTGVPVEDLALRDSFVDASRNTVDDIADRLDRVGLGEQAVIIGYLDHGAEFGLPDAGPVNAAAVVHQGEVISRVRAGSAVDAALDESQRFAHSPGAATVQVCGITVCLDFGSSCSEERQVSGQQPGIDLLAVITAWPYGRGQHAVRTQLVTQRAVAAGCPAAYVNSVGGQGELVFDGGSLVVDADGVIVSAAERFVESVQIVDLELDGRGNANADAGAIQPVATGTRSNDEPVEDIYQALRLGLRDYLIKNGFQRVILGLSGGIDSALVAVLACDAIGAENVWCISNPSEVSSQHSRADAAELARRTGSPLQTVPIAGIVRAFHDQLSLDGVAAENLQARIRGMIWMAESNQHPPSIVLACGNRSELSVGYSTIYGDAVGGFAPIKDIPKTMVWQLARRRNERAADRGETPPIPANIINKEPSAELRPGQRDSDSLPPYELLDDILDSADQPAGRSDLIARGFDRELVDRVLRMVDAAEHKRRQYPPGTTIDVRPLGRDRRLPIASRWRDGQR